MRKDLTEQLTELALRCLNLLNEWRMVVISVVRETVSTRPDNQQVLPIAGLERKWRLYSWSPSDHVQLPFHRLQAETFASALWWRIAFNSDFLGQWWGFWFRGSKMFLLSRHFTAPAAADRCWGTTMSSQTPVTHKTIKHCHKHCPKSQSFFVFVAWRGQGGWNIKITLCRPCTTSEI